MEIIAVLLNHSTTSSPVLSSTNWLDLHYRCPQETRRWHMCWPGRAGETIRSEHVTIFFVYVVWVDGCSHSVTLTCDILQFWQETVPELALLGSKHPECLWQASVKRDILLMFQREWRPICSLHTRIPGTSSEEINRKVSLCMAPSYINTFLAQNNSGQKQKKINVITQ